MPKVSLNNVLNVPGDALVIMNRILYDLNNVKRSVMADTRLTLLFLKLSPMVWSSCSYMEI